MQTMTENKVIPKELIECDQWALSNNKAPFQTNGERASSTDWSTWASYEDAISKSDNVGFFISEYDPYTVIDLDDCIVNGEITNEANSIVEALNSYTDISQSGTGLHVFVKGSKPGNRSKNSNKGFEMYDKERFMVMTGNHLEGTPIKINEAQDTINYLYDMYFPAKENKEKQVVRQSTALNDEEVLKIASNAKNSNKVKALLSGDISAYGSHSEADQALCNLIAFYTQDFEQIDRIFTNSGLYRDKWDREDYKTETIDKAINDLTATFQKKPKYQISFDNETKEISKNELIPKPFLIKYDNLYKTVTKGSGKNEEEIDILISRNIPFLTKEYHNMEYPQVFYGLEWKDRNKTVEEVVPASIISIRKDLLELSNKGFSVNDANARELIVYFDRYLQVNELPRHHAVERLGNVKGNFIHPVVSEDVEIIALDHGEKQLLESFEVNGTIEGWTTEVFERIKDSPIAVFMVLSSFASVVLKDLKIDPFIVDLSSSTSQGKTTTLDVASSVWGNSRLVNEWNATKVSIERKAAYLNSFPLLMDDTRKADEKALKGIVYQYSGGRSKGRGSIHGSQKEYTWNNILLSTGEVSLNEYAREQGGAAARIIPLNGQPIKHDLNNLIKLKDGIENNYGVIGIEFLKIWLQHKNELIPEYHQFRNHYVEKSKGNEVLSRIAGYYAAVHFVGSIIKDKLNLDIDLKAISTLFDEVAEENKNIDKPMQFLERILIDLDSKRDGIFHHAMPINQMTKAIYKKNQKQLYLTPAYTAEFLGVEENQTRKEWLKRKITIPIENKNGKKIDYKFISHKGKKMNAIALNMDVVRELGFDFHESEAAMNFDEE